MTNKQLRHQIITLHYIYPLPLQKLQLLLNTIEDLSELHTISHMLLAKILSISELRAIKIKSLYNEYLVVPFEKIYKEKDIHIIMYNDQHYPKELFQLTDPPTLLYVVGDITILSYEKIAIIGSRKATEYSRIALNYIVPPLVANQYTIVSGLARGADTMAHESTIQLGGKTIGVLGSGFDFIYPKENKDLFRTMRKNHCVITEFPPYMGPKKWHFPMRNRIISGISKALVVTEAAARSGTLITTEHALEHGKDVFVVPGPINHPQCNGTNQLLKEGAIPVWNGYQIVDEMSLFQPKI